jgi:hypothetical protein
VIENRSRVSGHNAECGLKGRNVTAQAEGLGRRTNESCSPEGAKYEQTPGLRPGLSHSALSGRGGTPHLLVRHATSSVTTRAGSTPISR